MASNPTFALDRARKVISAWDTNPELVVKDLTVADLKNEERTLLETLASLKVSENEVTRLQNQRDALAGRLRDNASRVLSAFRANYGPDSTQYEQAGGTRRSERKSPRRAAVKPLAKSE